MGLFKELVEPGVNREKRPPKRGQDFGPRRVSCGGALPQLEKKIVCLVHTHAFAPDNSRFRHNITSRFLTHFPFLLEIWYWNLTYWLYQLARAFSARTIRSSPKREVIMSTAHKHAIELLGLEQRLGIAVERPLQRFLLTNMPRTMPLFATIYHSHIIIGALFISYTYTFLDHKNFQRIRRTIAVDNWIAYVVLSVYRCAPPRFLTDYGFVDVLHPKLKDPQLPSWTNNSFQLTIAAMPSLHFGTSVLIGWSLFRFSPHRPVRVLAPLWPVAMLFTVVGTANHFILDCAAGILVITLGWYVNNFLLFLRPLEEWLFWLLRTERPRTADLKVAKRQFVHRWEGKRLLRDSSDSASSSYSSA